MKVLKWALFSVCLLGAGCSEVEEVQEEKKTPAIGVITETAEVETVVDSFRSLGEIEAADEVALYSKVKGKLVDYRVRKGATVFKGDVIANIERDEIGFKFEKAPVVSALTGTVAELPLSRGEEVRPDMPVAVIVDLNEVKAVAHVSEKHFGSVWIGQEALVSVEAHPDETFKGIISEISPIVDSKTRTFEVAVSIPNEERKLLPGMFARADIVMEEIGGTVVLPEQAVVSSQEGLYIYTMEEGRAVKRFVAIGKRIPGKVQVLEGVDAGEKVVVSGHHKIGDGSEIFVIEKSRRS